MLPICTAWGSRPPVTHSWPLISAAPAVSSWRYAPDALIPKAQGIASLTGKAWFTNPKVQGLMSLLPAPQGSKGPALTFLGWAQSFPHTMTWTMHRSGARTPSYYRTVQAAFEKYPEAIAAGLAKSPGAAHKDVLALVGNAKVEDDLHAQAQGFYDTMKANELLKAFRDAVAA